MRTIAIVAGAALLASCSASGSDERSQEATPVTEAPVAETPLDEGPGETEPEVSEPEETGPPTASEIRAALPEADEFNRSDDSAEWTRGDPDDVAETPQLLEELERQCPAAAAISPRIDPEAVRSNYLESNGDDINVFVYSRNDYPEGEEITENYLDLLECDIVTFTNEQGTTYRVGIDAFDYTDSEGSVGLILAIAADLCVGRPPAIATAQAATGWSLGSSPQ